jgi:hypothetical protein
VRKKQAQVIADMLRQNAGSEFCHQCLGRATDIHTTIVHRCALGLINNPFFVRRRGHCQLCASPRTKLLVRYKGTAPASDKFAAV